MAWMSRCCGGGKPKLPLGLDQWLLAAPYLLFYTHIGYWVIPSYLLAVLGLRLGHGRGFNYKEPFKPGSQPEKVEFLIPKNLPVYVRKALIMGLTGIAVCLIAAISLAAHSFYLAALILALSGALKAVAYLAPKTEISEYLRGGFLGLGLVIVLYLI